MPMPTGNREISNFTDSERIKTPKLTVHYKFRKTKKSISLDSRFVDLENTGLCATLSLTSRHLCAKHTPQSMNAYLASYFKCSSYWGFRLKVIPGGS